MAIPPPPMYWLDEDGDDDEPVDPGEETYIDIRIGEGEDEDNAPL